MTAWENREMPTQTRGLREGAVLLYSSLAQSVEHAAVNRRVVGSSPTGGAKNEEPPLSYLAAVLFYGPLAQLVRATGS